MESRQNYKGKINHEGHEESRRVEFDLLSNSVIGCALEVHPHLGPGLLESFLRVLRDLRGEKRIFSAPY